MPHPVINSAPIKINDRNLFSIQINSNDQLLIEGNPRLSVEGLRNDIKVFVLNEDKSNLLADNPTDAIISIKTDRGTSYKMFISILDEAQAAYYEIYAGKINLSPGEFRALNLNIAANRVLYEKAKKGIPMNISIADPTSISN